MSTSMQSRLVNSGRLMIVPVLLELKGMTDAFTP